MRDGIRRVWRSEGFEEEFEIGAVGFEVAVLFPSFAREDGVVGTYGLASSPQLLHIIMRTQKPTEPNGDQANLRSRAQRRLGRKYLVEQGTRTSLSAAQRTAKLGFGKLTRWYYSRHSP